MKNVREQDRLSREGVSIYPRVYSQAYVMLLDAVHRVKGLHVVLGALRDYRFSPADRVVLERVASALQQKRVGGGKDPEAVKERMRRGIYDVGRAVEAIRAALEQGDACEKNECAVGGCFRVVNTGGFDKQTMDRATSMVAEAAKLVTAAGFAQVCYGDAYVTQKVSRANVLAFYMRDEDRMYVRSNPAKGEAGLAVETIVHELGHRLHRKFLDRRDSEMSVVFQRWQIELKYAPVESTLDPKVGDTFTVGVRSKKVYRVTGVSGQGAYRMVVYRRLLPSGEVDPKYMSASTTVDKLSLALGTGKKSKDPFPSEYAKTSPSEMFAELFRAVVHGTATEEQRKAFDQIVGR